MTPLGLVTMALAGIVLWPLLEIAGGIVLLLLIAVAVLVVAIAATVFGAVGRIFVRHRRRPS